ncbi:MAG TPA: hypothetical protein VFK56_00410, partial [Mycobacterium sp.]|nr:hypothetical protein [Mycobacterium sp.]
MDPDRFHPLLTAHGPFASVYFDDSHDTQDARAQIELKWRALREQLEQQGAEQAIIERIEQAIGESAPAIGRSGRAVVATAGGIVTSDAIDAEGYPVHKASSAESSGYGDPQRTAEGARLKNIREVADRLTSLVDDVDPAVVFVVGEVQSRSDFAKNLPDRVALRAVHL